MQIVANLVEYLLIQLTGFESGIVCCFPQLVVLLPQIQGVQEVRLDRSLLTGNQPACC
ncbi:hypothetical protein D3C78_823560 [compost metagenome]